MVDASCGETPPALEEGAAPCSPPSWRDGGWALSEERLRLHYSDRGKRTARSKLVKEM